MVRPALTWKDLRSPPHRGSSGRVILLILKKLDAYAHLAPELRHEAVERLTGAAGDGALTPGGSGALREGVFPEQVEQLEKFVPEFLPDGKDLAEREGQERLNGSEDPRRLLPSGVSRSRGHGCRQFVSVPPERLVPSAREKRVNGSLERGRCTGKEGGEIRRMRA
jgi:hypothetical protein